MLPLARNIQVEDPDEPGVTLGEVDRIENGVLWEEKSAIFANDLAAWTKRHIHEKFKSYLRIRKAIPGCEDAAIGFHFERIPLPELRAAVEEAVERLRADHPAVSVLLRFGDEQ